MNGLKKKERLQCWRQVFRIMQQQQGIKKYEKITRQHVAGKPVDEATTFILMQLIVNARPDGCCTKSRAKESYERK